MGDDICKQQLQQGINTQNIQRTHTTQHQTNNPSKKWAEDLNRHFSPRRHTHGQQIHEKMLSFTIREMQIKTTMSFHLTPVRMAVIPCVFLSLTYLVLLTPPCHPFLILALKITLTFFLILLMFKL